MTSSFYGALSAKQGQAACRLLTQGTSEELEKSEKMPCAKAIGEADLDEATPASEHIYETSASVRLSNGQTAFLDRTPSGWRISAAGCKARPDQPYDCELED